MTVIYEPAPRYVVETADTIANVTGERMAGRWEFAFAFANRGEAMMTADRLAEDREYVRIIDRNPTTDNQEN